MRILIADGQARVRFALRTLLEQQTWGIVVGEASKSRELLPLVETTRPDLLLLDWELLSLAPVASLSALRELSPNLCVIALSWRSEVRRAALAAGADAFVSKTDPPEQLLAAIGDCEKEEKQ